MEKGRTEGHSLKVRTGVPGKFKSWKGLLETVVRESRVARLEIAATGGTEGLLSWAFLGLVRRSVT